MSLLNRLHSLFNSWLNRICLKTVRLPDTECVVSMTGLSFYFRSLLLSVLLFVLLIPTLAHAQYHPHHATHNRPTPNLSANQQAATMTSASQISIDELLNEAYKSLQTSPHQAFAPLQQLRERSYEFNTQQKFLFLDYYTSALNFSKKSQEVIRLLADKIPDEFDFDQKTQLNIRLSEAYTLLAEHEKSIHIIYDRLQQLNQLHDPRQKMRLFRSMTHYLNDVSQYDDALHYAEEAIKLAELEQSDFIYCNAAMNLLETYQLIKKYTDIDLVKRKAEISCDKSGQSHVYRIIRIILNNMLVDKGEYAKAIQGGLPLFNEIKRTLPESEYRYYLALYLARAYFNTGQSKLAQIYIEDAYQGAKNHTDTKLLILVHEMWAAQERNSHNYEQALFHANESMKLNQKLYLEQSQINMALQRIKLDTQDKANQLAMAINKNRTLLIEKSLEIKSKQNLWLVIILIIGLIVLLVLGLVCVVKQRNQFKRISEIDNLTGVSNRTHYMQFINQIFAARSGLVSVIVLDLDYFKKVNDTYGHHIGDNLLKEVGRVVTQQLRPSDVLGRIGGEEFAICCPNTNAEQAKVVAERCRVAIENIDYFQLISHTSSMSPNSTPFLPTASFGIACTDLAKNASYDEVYAKADQALYRAKYNGRNQIHTYHEL